MKRIYDANSTSTILSNVLPADFKVVKDKLSKGYVFMNALYGIEDDSIRDYIDQAKMFISFEHFDYGLDAGYAQVKIPGLIQSGYIYGDGIPVKLTTNEEFVDGKPTRMIYNSGLIDLDQYTISGSGLNGLEYMRIDKTGSGILFMNTNINSTDAVLSGTYSTYQLQLSDLIEQRNISGFNYGVQTQDYEETNRYELLHPELSGNIIRNYPAQKYVSLPKDGNSSNYNVKYLVDYYKPVTYYWDPDATPPTYKPILPIRDTYIDGDVETYYRVMLNNPSGSGVYDTEYLDLEHIPISGTLQVYDIDSLDDAGEMIEIDENGTQLYKYDHYDDIKISISGTVDKDYTRLTYTYIGYTSGIPYEDGLNLLPGVYAEPYKITSWDYVKEEDGLENFVWIEHPTNPITNKIKLVNPESRYVVTYKYALDKTQHCITTMNSDRYVKYYDLDYIYSSINLSDNKVILDATLSIENETRRAVTFNGFNVRPGSLIQQLELIGVITKEATTNKSKSINVTDELLIGKEDVVLPNIIAFENEIFKHNINNILFNPIGTTAAYAFVGNSIGQRINTSVAGLSNSTYYTFYDPDLREDRILRTRFRVKNVKNSQFDVIKSTTEEFSWKINFINGKLFVQDSISQFSTAEAILVEDDIVDIMVIANGAWNTTLQSQRFILIYSVNGSFFKYLHLYENPSVVYEEFTLTDETTILENTNIDLDYITLYDRGTL